MGCERREVSALEGTGEGGEEKAPLGVHGVCGSSALLSLVTGTWGGGVHGRFSEVVIVRLSWYLS